MPLTKLPETAVTTARSYLLQTGIPSLSQSVGPSGYPHMPSTCHPYHILPPAPQIHHLPCDLGRTERHELALLGPLRAWKGWHWAPLPSAGKLFLCLQRENQVTQGHEQEHTPSPRGLPVGLGQAGHRGRSSCPSPVSTVWLSSSHGPCTSPPGAGKDGGKGSRATASSSTGS